MKTKQQSLKAAFTTEQSNAVNLDRDQELINRYVVIDKKTEKTIIDCRVYMGKSRNASVVRSSIWVDGITKPDGWIYAHTSGHGKAGGYGYDKESAAIEHAISNAGIELYGEVYYGRTAKPDFKKRAHIGGVGSTAVRSALLAIAYAAGCKDAICVGF